MTSLNDYLAANRVNAPTHLGTRYAASGQFLPDGGNTVVCHVQAGSASEKALLAARTKISEQAGAAFAFTAPESLHMTLFQGILDRRRSLPHWPQDVALDTPVQAMTQLFAERLRGLALGPAFAVEAIAALPTGLIVDGVTAGDRHALASWRNCLADIFGYRHADHDAYEFHITFSYPITWIEAGAVDGWQKLLDEVLADVRRDAPVLELRAPAFCSFDDMNWFEELLVLDEKVDA